MFLCINKINLKNYLEKTSYVKKLIYDINKYIYSNIKFLFINVLKAILTEPFEKKIDNSPYLDKYNANKYYKYLDKLTNNKNPKDSKFKLF